MGDVFVFLNAGAKIIEVITCILICICAVKYLKK